MKMTERAAFVTTRLLGKSPPFASLLGHMTIPVITLLDFWPYWFICGSGFDALKRLSMRVCVLFPRVIYKRGTMGGK